MDEVEFFNDGKVSVSSARFRVGTNTYAMQGVTSVKRGQKDPNKLPAVLLVIVGIFMLISADPVSTKAFGVIMIMLGFVIFKLLKPEFSVYLNSSSGESQALQSKDRNYIDQVIEALNQSIVHRG